MATFYVISDYCLLGYYITVIKPKMFTKVSMIMLWVHNGEGLPEYQKCNIMKIYYEIFTKSHETVSIYSPISKIHNINVIMVVGSNRSLELF